MIRRSLGDRLADGVIYAILGVLILITLYPVYYVLVSSISNASQLLKYRGLLLWPQEIGRAHV